MKPIAIASFLRTIHQNSSFDDLLLSEKGLIINSKNKLQKTVLYSEIDKVYLKKYKLHPVVELFGILIPFILIYIVVYYVLIDILILASLFTIPPVCMIVFNYKWYRLFIYLKDGTSYQKKVFSSMKAEGISIVERLRAKSLHSAFISV